MGQSENPGRVKIVYSDIFKRIHGHSPIFSHVQGHSGTLRYIEANLGIVEAH